MILLKNILAVLGGFILLAIIAVFVFLSYQMSPAAEKINEASAKDVLFVLNWGGLNNTQNHKVLYSYQSPAHFQGDHLDYYCIQLEEFVPNSRNQSSWVFGSEDNELINQARKFVASSGKAGECFNAEVLGVEQNVAAYIWAAHINGRNVSGAQIILYHEPSNRVLYVSFET